MAVDSSGWMGKKWLLWIGFVPFLIKGKAVFHASGSRMQSQQSLAGSSRSANTTSLGSRLAMSYIYLSGYKDTTARQPAARLVTIHQTRQKLYLTRTLLGVMPARAFSEKPPARMTMEATVLQLVVILLVPAFPSAGHGTICIEHAALLYA